MEEFIEVLAKKEQGFKTEVKLIEGEVFNLKQAIAFGEEKIQSTNFSDKR